ncbi:MAG: exo-alpha-sialidase [Bacteroidales bacterium]|nr:exo-alpha-sialidase [Bacteroidales bacterium]
MKFIILFIALLLTASLSQAQWEPDVRLTNNPFTSYLSRNTNAKVIAATGDTIHVVWADDRDGNYEIYYKRSTDKGLSWEADVRLTDSAGWSYDPSVAVSGSVVHVMWCDRRTLYQGIYYKRSEDGGSTWTADIRLTVSFSNSESPALVIDGLIIHVVWYDLRNGTGLGYEIYYKRSTDGGLTWGPDTRLTYDPSYSGYPGIVVSGSLVHIVWEDNRDGNGQIYYKQSNDNGITWGPDIRLTNTSTNSWDPCISLNGSVLHVVWMDMRDGLTYEIYYNRSTDGGTTWSPDTRLTNDNGNSGYPTMAVSGSILHIVWQDTRDGEWEIYYKQSTDAGVTWGEDLRLTNANVDAGMPFIALSDSIVYVIWEDLRDGGVEEIYYKRNPTGNIPVGTGNDVVKNNWLRTSIWPNPASGLLHLDFDTWPQEKALLGIRNLLGYEVFRGQIENMGTMVDVSGLQNGLYFVNISTGNKQTVSKKLIILK